MKEVIKARSEELRSYGIEPTSSWVNEPYDPTIQDHKLTDEEYQALALKDVQDIVDADILVLHTDPTKTIFRAGRHVEFGIAVARYMPIFVVGMERENIFHHLPQVEHFSSWTYGLDRLFYVSVHGLI